MSASYLQEKSAAAFCCLLLLGVSAAPATAAAPNVTFTASGTFGFPAISGDDELKLGGQPFTISIVANAAAAPVQHGANWALMSPFHMTGTVHSGLIGSTPVNIASQYASILQAMGPSYDVFITGFPLKVVGINITIKATMQLPPGTLTTPLVHPFSAVALSPGNSTVTYTDESGTTTLAVQAGSLVASLPSGTGAAQPALASPALHAGGAQVVTAQADGTRSTRPLSAGPVSFGAVDDQVVVRFYASGVQDGADVRVTIGGEEVPVLYAGKSGYFPGLDEIHVLLPHSLAGRGSADAVLTVSGQAAKPVPIRIQ